MRSPATFAGTVFGGCPALTGRYPTPIIEGKPLGAAEHQLWVKNDGLTHDIYGGNKVRKLEPLLAEAARRGARRLLTFGAAGSHHVLATTVFGRRAGFEVAAILWPRPWEEHAERTLRAAIGQGLEAYPATAVTVPEVLVRRRRRGDFVIFAGGMSLSAVLAYVDAVGELVDQVREGVMPDPDTIVVALGTGTTLAGLLAGVALHGLKARLVGVEVAWNPLSRAGVLALAHAAVRARRGSLGPRHLGRRLDIDGGRVGGGYGQATALARRAAAASRGVGLDLDPTYTAKAFSRALEEVHHPEFAKPSPMLRVATPRQTLYWHTLSAVSLDPLLERAPPLDPALQKLLIRPGAPQ